MIGNLGESMESGASLEPEDGSLAGFVGPSCIGNRVIELANELHEESGRVFRFAQQLNTELLSGDLSGQNIYFVFNYWLENIVECLPYSEEPVDLYLMNGVIDGMTENGMIAEAYNFRFAEVFWPIDFSFYSGEEIDEVAVDEWGGGNPDLLKKNLHELMSLGISGFRYWR